MRRGPRYSPECVEGCSLLKNSLYARFGPRSGPKHTVCGAIWSLWSPIRSHCELSADFFNWLGASPKSAASGGLSKPWVPWPFTEDSSTLTMVPRGVGPSCERLLLLSRVARRISLDPLFLLASIHRTS